MTIEFQPVTLRDVPWHEFDDAPDRTIFQTGAWLHFLEAAFGADPLVARVVDDGRSVGWFTGALSRRAGIRMLGAPLRGWTTPAMGFNLAEDADRSAALAALVPFAFGPLRCAHLEFADRALLLDGLVPGGFTIEHLDGYELELVDPQGRARDDDDLLAAMSAHGRRDVRRAGRNGIDVREVDPSDPDFARRYHEQVTQAFARRNLVPPYPPDRVQALMDHLGPTGDLLLLEARTADGEPAATGIFPGLPGRTAEFWMGASDRRQQSLLPNEALMWTALRTWRDRGAVRFNFGGGGRYKAKYGGTPHHLPWVRCSRYAMLEQGRRAAMRVHHLSRRRRSR